MDVQVLDLCESPDRKSHNVDQAKPKLLLQPFNYVEIRIRKMNRRGFQLAAFSHGRWT